MTNRDDRRWQAAELDKDPPDRRTPGQRDRDRILYTHQFRRLAEVTQVVGSHEMDLFHTRLTHTLEVGQIARRIAERWLADHPDDDIDADVVEAAALAHDLGHPPFGHIAEDQLDTLLVADSHHDGFEGNAQSFRIVTKLARRSRNHPGLDLTRASLQALTKYPWARGTSGKRHRKFGTFHPEESDFRWSREGLPNGSVDEQTIEATIMDWSDDVAYALHDTDDFFKAGLIPLDRLADDLDEQERFLIRTFDRWENEGKALLGNREDYIRAAENLFAEFPREAHVSASARGIMATLVPFKINSYVNGLRRDEAGKIAEDPDMRREIDLMKSLTWTYVIEAPALAAQQEGQRRIIDTLYGYYSAAASRNPHVLPTWAQAYLSDEDLTAQHESIGHAQQRVACDIIASLSERQAYALFARLTGHDSGTVVTAIVG